MTTVLSYRGRDVTDADVSFIRELIAAHPAASRRALSLKLCEAWAWLQPNGRPRDMVCRSMLIALDRAGAVRLPAPKKRAPISQRIRPRPARCDLLRWSPIDGPLSAIRPLEFRQVRRTADEPLFGSLIETHHYLGYVQPVGEHLKYMVFSHGAPVACLAFSSAPRHLGPRDRFIGWSPEARRRNIRFVAYNARYLILPWVRVPHLASHILGLVARRISADWEALYAHPVQFLETFIDPTRYRGTCYRAANWVLMGQTTGRGNNDRTNRPNRSIKQVWGYPLRGDFRERLAGR